MFARKNELVFIENELEINFDCKKRIRIWFILLYKDCARNGLGTNIKSNCNISFINLLNIPLTCY